jgi:hypothetical protein
MTLAKLSKLLEFCQVGSDTGVNLKQKISLFCVMHVTNTV